MTEYKGYCPDYVGVACIDGSFPIANREILAEHCIPVIRGCSNCGYYEGCADCAMADDCDRKENTDD